MWSIQSTSSRMGATSVTTVLGIFLCIALTSGSAAQAANLPLPPLQVGLLINFSVPCDLNSAIAVPDQGGLLTPVLLGVGYQEYAYGASKWKLVGENALLFNKSLVQVGTLSGTSASITFKLFPSTPGGDSATVTAAPNKTVAQAFSIPLELLSVTGSLNESTYSASDYVQRFGTQGGLPPAASYSAKNGQIFRSQFSAYYAFFLPFSTSPQLATRVPRCGDERFYGLQFGRTFP